MKFRILILSIVTSLVLAIPSNAVQPQVAYATSFITFDGTTAYCSATVAAETPSEKITAVITLWDGATYLNTWNEQATGYLAFSTTATVERGRTYTLNVDATVGDKTIPTASNTKTCP